MEVSRAGVDAQTREGIAYFLPFTQFSTKIDWTIDCDEKTKEPVIALSATVTPSTGPDPDALYVIDYRSLSAFTKTSSVDVDFYESGAIKSINAEADDKTGEMLTKTLNAVGAVAKFAAVGSTGEGNQVMPVCSTDVLSGLSTVETDKGTVERLTTQLKIETAELERVTAQVTRAGDSASDALRSEHLDRINGVFARQLELDAAKRKLEESLKAITYSKTVSFPSMSYQTTSSEGIKLPETILKKWIGNTSEITKVSPNYVKDQSDFHSAWLELTSQSQILYGNEHKTAATSKAAGIRYRVGLPGTLTLCSGAACSDSLDENRKVVKSFPVKILQQGSTFYLPFKSAAFTNGSLNATFSEAGVLTSAGYKQKRAPGEAIAGLVETLSGQIVSVGEAIREEEQSDLDKKKDELALAKVEEELAELLRAQVESPNNAIEVQTAALTALNALKQQQVISMQADIALKEAQAKLAETDGDD